MSDMQSSSKAHEQGGSAIGNALRWIVRFLIVVVIFFAVGVGIYYAFPLLYNQFVKPVQEHSVQISDLQAQQKMSSDEWSTRLDELQRQMDTLTLQQDNHKETLADLNARLTSAEGWKQANSQLASRMDALQEKLGAVEAQQTILENELAKTRRESSGQDTKLATLEKALQSQNEPLAAMQQQLTLLKVMELISRGRVSMLGNNYGLAQNDLQAARSLLVGLKTDARTFQKESVQSILDRLDMALGNVTSAPQLVDKDLEVAWQLLLSGLPASALQSVQPTAEMQEIAPLPPTPTPYEEATAVFSTPTPLP